MARLQIHTKAPDISMDAVIPERMVRSGEKAPLLWMLHDFGGNSSSWMRFVPVELLAENYGIAVVCISGENGFFVDNASGVRWDANFIDKLWPTVQEMLPVSDRREDNFVAGCGMGGYGAIHMALTHPDVFSWAGSFNGWLRAAVDYARGNDEFPEGIAAEDIFGQRGQVMESDVDLKHLMRRWTNQKKIGIYLACSLDARVLEENKSFAKTARELEYSVIWDDSGNHGDWRFLGRQAEKFIHVVTGAREGGEL